MLGGLRFGKTGLVCLIVILFVVLVVTHTSSAKAKNPWRTVAIKKTPSRDTPIEVNVKYPQFLNEIGCTGKAQAMINREIRKLAISRYHQELTRLKEIARENFQTGSSYILSIDYDHVYCNKQVVSFALHCYTYSGGAHGMTENIVFNRMIRNGKAVELKDLFVNDPEYLECLSNACFVRLCSILQDPDPNGFMEAGLKPESSSFNNFVLSKRGMSFLFEEYQVAPYSEGMPEVTFSYEELRPLLKLSVLPRIIGHAISNQVEDFEQAKKYWEQKKATTLVSLYSKRIAKDSQNERLYSGRAGAYQDLERYPAALNDYNKALKLSPNDGICLYNRGLVNSELGHYDKALDDYNAALECDPTLTAVYEQRGISYLALKRPEEALGELTHAITLEPDNHCLYCYRGQAHLALKHYEKAIADFSDAISLEPDDSHCYDRKAYCLLKLGKYQEALLACNQAIKLNEQQGDFYQTRAQVYRMLKEDSKASNDEKQALQLGFHEHTLCE